MLLTLTAWVFKLYSSAMGLSAVLFSFSGSLSLHLYMQQPSGKNIMTGEVDEETVPTSNLI